jgi:mannosylglucosylglycerate synthase
VLTSGRSVLYWTTVETVNVVREGRHSLRAAFVHYSAPPVVGGVESIIHAHARTFLQAGYSVTVVAGRGAQDALPSGTSLALIPEMDSVHPAILRARAALERGQVPPGFGGLADHLAAKLAVVLEPFDHVIVHNVLSMHYNLALTAALFQLLERGRLRGCINWCHDLSWTSLRSRPKVFAGQPWDLLRTYHPDVTYVAVSRRRRAELVELVGCEEQRVHVIYSGVEPAVLLGLSTEGLELAERLELLAGDLNLLMPVRITPAKNIEFALRLAGALKSSGCSPRLIVTGPPDPHDEQSVDYFASLRALRVELGLEHEARFVFDSGPDPDVPHIIGMSLVSELLRLADLMLMPSHSEGFGMPVLEAALVGVPVVATDVPAAEEIGGDDVLRFDAGRQPADVASEILEWLESNPISRLRRRVRQRYSWQAIFRQQIQPLLGGPN